MGDNSFGFPSGDVQVAAIFWLSLFLNMKESRWRYLWFLPIIVIGLSRVYLGVHSIYDVFFGLFFAIITIIIWHIDAVQNYAKNCYEKSLIKAFGYRLSL